MNMNLAVEAGLLKGDLPDRLFPPSVAGLSTEANGIVKSQSPVAEFLVDEEAASVCPLLSPSPPTEFEHPLALPSAMGYDHQISPSSTDPELTALSTVNGKALQPLGNGNTLTTGGLAARPEPFDPASSVQSMVESSSSSSSVLHESAVCAQLLSHRYQHFTASRDGDPFTLQENGGKSVLTGCIQLAVRKSTEDYSFVDWNWPMIRKMSFWTVISLLLACMCVVVGLVAQLPTRCAPQHAWWQGTLFYEIFPASFKDHNSDGYGDFSGLLNKVEYLESLGIRAVRLNSIFASDHYPDDYYKVKNLSTVDKTLGTLKDFEKVVNNLHERNISIILDLPLRIFLEQLQEESGSVVPFLRRDNQVLNEDGYVKREELFPFSTGSPDEDEDGRKNVISEALEFWLNIGVDGFYLKDLQNLTDDRRFASFVRQWRKIVDKFSFGLVNQKILMCSLDVLHSLNGENSLEKVNSVLNHMDLIDVHLDLYNNGTEGIKKYVNEVLEGILYKKPGYPWIHWNVGSIETHRLAAQSGSAEGNLAAILFTMMLPGTPSIFYGDEIGLENYLVPEGEQQQRRQPAHPPQLAPMHWSADADAFGFTAAVVLPWLHPSRALSSVAAGGGRVVRAGAAFRAGAPSIYMNGVVQDGGAKTPNCEVRTLGSDVVVVQRWFPRRHSYVLVANLGADARTRDLSSWLYGGEVVVDQRSRVKGQYVKFDSLTLGARESVIVKLDK